MFHLLYRPKTFSSTRIPEVVIVTGNGLSDTILLINIVWIFETSSTILFPTTYQVWGITFFWSYLSIKPFEANSTFLCPPPPKTLLIKKKLSGFLNNYFVFLREEYILQRNVPLIRNDDEGASAYDEGASA